VSLQAESQKYRETHRRLAARSSSTPRNAAAWAACSLRIALVRRTGIMRHRCFRSILVFAILSLVASPAESQNTVGGHFGVLFPLVTHADGTTTDISEDFTIGFPVGITVRKNPTFAFDLELVSTIQNEPLDVGLTVHPGVLWGFADKWNAGIRVAFDVNQASWGFTPLVNYAFADVGGGSSLFAEAVVPVRFQEDIFGDSTTSVGLGVHVGIGF
jgi:hypothetical protein